MKTTLKILLLIIAVFGGIIAVMMFAKTRVAPPGKVDTMNQYTAHLDSVTNAFRSVTDLDSAIVGNQALNHKIRLLNREEYIDNDQADNAQSTVDSVYCNNVTDYAFSVFKGSMWPEKNLAYVTQLVNDVNSRKLLNGETSITESQSMNTAKVLNTIATYREAWKYAGQTKYNNDSDARQKIAQAKKYANMQYLSNNTALVNALNDMPLNIAKNHLGQVSSKVKQLGNYHLNEYEYRALISDAQKAISNYKKSNYCSNKPSISKVEDTAGRLIDGYWNKPQSNYHTAEQTTSNYPSERKRMY